MEEKIITSDQLDLFSKIIPNIYFERIKSGELLAVAIIDSFYDNALIGCLVLGRQNNWVEILHFYISDDYITDVYAPLIIRQLFRRLEISATDSIGIFSDFSVTDYNASIERSFRESGFDIDQTDGGIFSFNLSQIKRSLMIKNASSNNILLLKDADEHILHSMQSVIQEESKIVPIRLPINWDDYDKDLSLIRLSDGKPAGLILVQRNDRDVTVSLGYDTDAKGFLKSISALVEQADKILPLETECYIPVVNDSLIELIKYIVPEIKRNREFIAYKTFSRTPSFIDEAIDQ